MTPIVHSVEIDRAPDEVFAYVTDPSHFTEWQAAVVSAHAEDSGPLQGGLQIGDDAPDGEARADDDRRVHGT